MKNELGRSNFFYHSAKHLRISGDQHEEASSFVFSDGNCKTNTVISIPCKQTELFNVHIEISHVTYEIQGCFSD